MFNLIIRFKFLILALVVGLTLVFALNARHLDVEQGNDSMNSMNEEMQRNYSEFKRMFGNDELIVVALSGKDWQRPEETEYLNTTVVSLSRLNGVKEVVGLDSVSLPPVLGVSADNSVLEHLFLSDDGRTTGIFVTIEERPEDDGFRRRLISEIDELLSVNIKNGVTYHLTGVPVQKVEVARLVERDQKVVIPLSIGILAVTLLLMFRSVWGVVMPLLLTGLSLVWTLGVYSFLGNRLNPITSLLPPLIMVLSVTTGVHMFQGWMSACAVTSDRAAALKHLYDELLTPCFFTALTTAAGLASLAVNPIPAVKLFGMFGAMGVGFTFLLGTLFLPTLFFLIPQVGRVKKERFKNDWLDRLLELIALKSVSKARVLFAFGLAVAAGSIALIPRIHSNTDLVGFLKSDERLYKDTRFVDRELGGSNSFEFMVRRKDGKPMNTPENLKRIATFIKESESLSIVHSGVSVTTLIQHVLPGDTFQPPGAIPIAMLLDRMPQEPMHRFITPDWTCARVRFRLESIGTSAAAPVLDEIQQLGVVHLGNEFHATPTGDYYYVVMGSNRLVESQVISFALALCAALAAIGILLRSGIFMFVAMIPNIIPILLCGGLMAVFGIDLSTGTAMIASVTIGLAVDDTIYYLAGFKRRWKGSVEEALESTTRHTGRALVISSIVLAVGFWVGCFGSFKPTIYFSLLTGVTMLSALACDLLVLPATLKLILPPQNPRSDLSNNNP